MTRFSTLAALIALAAAPATAGSHGMTEGNPAMDAELEYGEAYRVTTLMGTPIHITTEAMPSEQMPMPADMIDEWQEVGEIGDLLIGVDGSLEAVVIDVGGFLGVGEKEVAIPWATLRPVHEEDNMQEWFLGVQMSRAELEAAPELEREPAN
jgi:hypothetical protein